MAFVKKYDWWLTDSEVDIAYKELKQKHLGSKINGCVENEKKT